MKRRALICMLLCTCFLGGVQAQAETGVDFDYTGEIDAFTGETLEGEEKEQEQEVALSGGVIYDRESGMYRYPVGEGIFSAGAYTGMVVTGSVALQAEEGTDVLLYKDGKKVAEFPGQVDAPGSYVVTAGGKDGSPVMNFKIVSEVTGKIERYDLPSGFAVESVMIDGEKAGNTRGSVELKQEGEYEISYYCVASGVRYELRLTIDHTPPEVLFEGLNEKNEARGPVKVTGIADDDTVTITRDGEETELDMNEELKAAGKYHLVVTDRAGNSVKKDFRIFIYFNIQAWMFFGLVVLIAIGIFVALWISKKRIRIR